MPHAVFSLGETTGTTRDMPRSLIPGVEPGGSRVGQPMKPALLIINAWAEPISVDVRGAEGINEATYGLILSQENNLNPGFTLPISARAASSV